MNNRQALLMMAGMWMLTGGMIASADAQLVTREGTKLTSDSFPVFGVESEVADNFSLPFAATVTQIAIIGGPYDATGLPTWSFGIRFYSDAGGTPDVLLTEFDAFNIPGTPAGTDIGPNFFPLYSYNLPVSFPGNALTTYWYSVQALDHPFPPQWGVKLTSLVNPVGAMFRSNFFNYPNFPGWGAESTVPEEHSIDAQIIYQGPDAVYPTTWGKIRGLYR